MLCGWRVLEAAKPACLQWGRTSVAAQVPLVQQQIRSIHKRIYVPKPYKTLHPVPKEPVTTVPSGPIEHPVEDFFTKQKTGTVQLDREVFGAPLRIDILQRVVVWQMDARRQGTHKGKTRAEVRGGGRKPWKQKGTGRARIGSIRAPHWRGGGRVFPPTPRDHSTDLPVKVRAFGLKVALSAKLAQGKLKVVDSLELPSHKTKDLATKYLPEDYGSVLLVEHENINVNLDKAAANIRYVDVLNEKGVNVYDLLSRNTIVITKPALEKLTQRVKDTLLGFRTLRMLRHKKLIAEELAEAEKEGLVEKEEKERERKPRKKAPRKF